MPESSTCGKQYLSRMVHTLHQASPFNRILDVGTGVGTYRQLLADLVPVPLWYGVEVWPPYVERYRLHQQYDQLLISDIRSLDLSQLPPLDLVILGDVLEHMTKEDAQAVVARLLEQTRLAVISIPVVVSPQGEACGNPFERHVKDDWSHQEVVDSFPGICAMFLHGWIGVYLLTRDDRRFVEVRRNQPLVAQQVRQALSTDFILWA